MTQDRAVGQAVAEQATTAQGWQCQTASLKIVLRAPVTAAPQHVGGHGGRA